MAGLKIFNSLTRKKEVFRARNNKVGLYVCGVTPYNVTHLGHAFTYVFFDAVMRYLKFLGYQTTYVQNLTDIDDDILKRAKKEKRNWRLVVKLNTRKFLADMTWLSNVQPDFYTRATDHIQEIIEIIKKLLQNKAAYEKAGSVYFHVAFDKDYGKLSKLTKKAMLLIANERGNDPKDKNKLDLLDFVLWQAQKPGEPAWPSPWGRGRPGWHIECTAMALKYLGETFDIQGGGSDLIFPHHESTIAQSEFATGKKPYVRYWMHTGMLRYEGEKMSKSLGNLILIDDLRKKYSANIVRIFLLSHHYRDIWEYFEKDLKEAQKLNALLQSVWQAHSGPGEDFDNSRYEKKFFRAMNDDFDIKSALEILQESARQILKNQARKNITGAKSLFYKAFVILGLKIEY